MDDHPEKSAARTPRWVKLLLIASLGINLLIMGMVGGAILSGDAPGKNRNAARETLGSPFVRALEPHDRRGVLRGLSGERQSLRENRETLRARFDALLVALRSDTFDINTVEALLEDQRNAILNRNKVGETVVLQRIADMSVEERRAYADRLEAEVKRRSRP